MGEQKGKLKNSKYSPLIKKYGLCLCCININTSFSYQCSACESPVPGMISEHFKPQKFTNQWSHKKKFHTKSLTECDFYTQNCCRAKMFSKSGSRLSGSPRMHTAGQPEPLKRKSHFYSLPKSEPQLLEGILKMVQHILVKKSILNTINFPEKMALKAGRKSWQKRRENLISWMTLKFGLTSLSI